MEKPRIRRLAEPEIHFAGGSFAPASQAGSDPAIHAAFVAFHRNNTGALAAAPRKRSINRGGIALAALALLGFGGGLSLAFFAFNSPEKPANAVASRAPEIIYTAPARAAETGDTDAAPVFHLSERGLFATTPFELRAEDEPIPETSIWRGLDHDFADAFAGIGGAATASSLALAGQSALPAASALGAATAEITTGFDALTAAPVPEPSTWASMLSGAGLLLVFAKLKRRRS